jgi:hypothetical protein
MCFLSTTGGKMYGDAAIVSMKFLWGIPGHTGFLGDYRHRDRGMDHAGSIPAHSTSPCRGSPLHR